MCTFRGIAGFLAVLASCLPCSAIVINTGSPSSLNVTFGSNVHGVDLSGVVLVHSDGGTCSGSLLSDGISILTAGHCVTNMSPLNFSVRFMNSSGFVFETVSSVAVDPQWAGDFTTDTDLAVLHLSQAAPGFAARYNLFTGTPDLNAVNVVAGYGYGGSGATGFDPVNYAYGVLRAGTNKYGATGARLNEDSDLLVAQMYKLNDGTTNVLGAASPYWAADAAGLAPGDSGGPTFQGGLLVGVHHEIGCFYKFINSTICDTASPILNESFGQYFEDTNVSTNISWILAQEVASVAPEPATAALALAGIVFLWLGRARLTATLRQVQQPIRSRVRPELDRS